MKKALVLTTSILLIILILAACQVSNRNGDQELGNTNKLAEKNNKTAIEETKEDTAKEKDNKYGNTPEDEKKYKVTLYFGDPQGNGLFPEEREVTEVNPRILIEELIKGPQNEESSRTIPEGTKLLDVKVKDGIAYVNFSKELKTNHWGGSTGESMTIYSIVNTLTLNPQLEIEKVQFLIEGEKIETLAGHIGIMEPIGPDLEASHLK